MRGGQYGLTRHRPGTTPPPSGTESPAGTAVTAAGQTINASRVIGSASTGPFDTFALTAVGGFIIFNGTTDTVNSANVIELYYTGHRTYQQNSSFLWWGWSGTAWMPTTDPRVAGTPTFGFTVKNGQVLTPAGAPFFAKGLAVAVDILQGTAISNLTTGAPLMTVFPKANIIRIACYQPPPYPTSGQLAPYVNCLTNLGVVCLIEDHSGPDGGSGQMFTGARLAQQQAFYADMASAFKNNPFVWLCTLNEPSNDAQGTVTTNEVQTYNTIRNAGFTNIIGMQQVGGGVPSIEGANNPAGLWPDSAYASMTNITFNPHFYPYMTSNSASLATINGVINQIFGLCQQIQSADGVVPIIFDEFGVTVGATPDSNGPANAGALMTAVNNHAVNGAVAWEWGPFPAGNAMQDFSFNLTAWGQQVSAWLS